MAKIEGLDKLKNRIYQMPAEVRKEVSAAIEKSAIELVATMKRFARFGAYSHGDLANSIKWDWSGSGDGSSGLREGRAAQLAAKGNQRLSAMVTAGDRKVFYARFVEFGTAAGQSGTKRTYEAGTGGSGLGLGSTVGGGGTRRRKVQRSHTGTTAQPFFFPAYRMSKKRMQARISRATSKAIKRFWGR